MKLPTCCFICAALLFDSGCTFPKSPNSVSESQTGVMQVSDVGTVIKVTPVVVDGRRTALGQYGGAVIGGAAAVPAGGITSTGGAIAAAGASVVGAILGESVEEFSTRKKAQEITVQMKKGDIVTIIQASPPEFMVGDTVEVVHSAYGARVEMYMETQVVR
jgi:outer membrane lipoprotein SlyB